MLTPSSRTRTSHYRARLRTLGLRPVQIWVPDTTRPGFAEAARQQCIEINEADRSEAIMEWLEEVSWFDDPAGDDPAGNDAAG